MAIIEINRSSEYSNRLRKIKLFLDGKQLGVIANGETISFETNAGTHKLQAKIDWCTSNTIDLTITGNEKRSFDLTSFARHSSLGVFAAIYYITFGAGKYLNLKEK